MTAPRLALRIEELAVEGLGPAKARRFARALERALAARLAASPLPTRAAALDRLDAGTLRLAPPASPERLGEAVAGRLVAALAPRGA
jgi:hypothetical protein